MKRIARIILTLAAMWTLTAVAPTEAVAQLKLKKIGSVLKKAGEILSDPADAAAQATGATADKFEGVATNNRTTEYDLEGRIYVRKGVGVGVMRYGRIYVRVADGDEPAYGDPLLLVINGDEAGCFTSTEDSGNTIAVNGRFLGSVDNGVSPVELMREPVTGGNASGGGGSAGATKLSDLSDVDLSNPATDGQVLKYDNASSKWKPGDDNTGA